MAQSILLRGARQLLTLRGNTGVRRGPQHGNLEVIEDGSVLIRDGRIVSVGSTRRLENLKEIRGALDIPVHNCIVMPGFVDPALRLGLMKYDTTGRNRHKRRKLLEFYNDSVVLMRSCLQHGTLNLGVHTCSQTGSLRAELALLRQLTRIGNNPIGMTRIWRPESAYNEPEQAQNLAATVQFMHKHKFAESIDLAGEMPAADTARLAGAASGLLSTSFDWDHGTPESLETRIGNAPATVHCSHALTPEECNVLGESPATAVFGASSALLDQVPVDSARNVIDAGGAIALTSGYDAWSELNFNMQLVLAVAVMRMRLTIEEAIMATTLNAAHAIHRGHEIGSIEPGKRAEILVLNLPDYRQFPRRLGVNHVAMAIRDGNIAINRTRWKVGAA